MGGGGRGAGRGRGASCPSQVVLGEAQFQQLMGQRTDSMAKLSKDFTQLGGKRYDGLGGAVKAVTWIEGCEEAFSSMLLTPIQQRTIATQVLDGAALHWWREIGRAHV